MSNRQSKEIHKTSIGGQALIEGIMMRGVHKTAMAVRKPDKTIELEIWDTNSKNSFLNKIKKVPFVRGVFGMVDSMILGYKCTTKSAQISCVEEDEQPSKFEKWLEKKFGDNLVKVVTAIGAVLGIVLSVLLFMLFPTSVVWFINRYVEIGVFKGLIEGILKIIIFIIYLLLISKLKDINRVFRYHGAEHKTIACFEAGEELTVENIKKQIRFHPRCGTSFLILVLIISILIFSVVTWSNPVIRTLLKIGLLPIVIGITYELIKIAGRYDNWFTRAISYPGVLLQHITTQEPDDEMIEVAIEAMKPVLPNNLEEDKW